MASYNEIATRLAQACTFLFVPGNRPDRFASAWNAGADVVILDLEASVHPDSKAQAREEVVRWLQIAPSHVTPLIRVNQPGSPALASDLLALRDLPSLGLMCSYAQLGHSLDAVLAAASGRHPVVLLIENAQGVEQASQLASSPGVCRLAFGNMDYVTELHLGSGTVGLIYPSSKIAVASSCAGLPPPIAGVTADIHNAEILSRDMHFERDIGFGAKMCIHPKQVAPVREIFEPSPAETAWAHKILAATSKSHAVSVDGQMVDRPVIDRARAIVARARVNPTAS